MFHSVAKTSDLTDPGKMLVEVEDRLIALFHVDGAFYALDDVCTHDGGPLAEGEMDGCQIICPRHGARFDITTGAALTMPATKATTSHEVKIEGDEILVQLSSD